MLQNYSPNLHIRDIVSALFIQGAKQKVIKFYQKYTHKKYIICTGSCRTSLFLAHSVTPKHDVYTTPLTCSVSIIPILKAGKKVHYIDITHKTLNIDFNKIDSSCKILQMNYFGGNYSDEEINNLIRLQKKGVVIIEDCAQAFTLTNTTQIGTIGDIICFSMIKNAYGIGGGIFATDNFEYYLEAKDLLRNSKKTNISKLLFRCFRNIIETNRQNSLVEVCFHKLMKLRPHINDSKNENIEINQISKLELQLFTHQSKKFLRLHNNRKIIGQNILSQITKKHGNCKNIGYTKLFINYITPNIIELLNNHGIECKHLQNKYGSFHQKRFDLIPFLYNASILECKYYLDIHDHIISLPLFETMTKKEENYLIKTITDLQC